MVQSSAVALGLTDQLEWIDHSRTLFAQLELKNVLMVKAWRCPELQQQ